MIYIFDMFDMFDIFVTCLTCLTFLIFNISEMFEINVLLLGVGTTFRVLKVLSFFELLSSIMIFKKVKHF